MWGQQTPSLPYQPFTTTVPSYPQQPQLRIPLQGSIAELGETMTAFVPPVQVKTSAFTPSTRCDARAPVRDATFVTPVPCMVATVYPNVNKNYVTPVQEPISLYNPVVDEFFARDVTNQYITKACPTGVPPIQCIEGTTFDEPYELRTLKRQSQLRYRQLPTSVKVHNMYEARRNAIIACHGCSHEESRVVSNPMLANAMTFGQAESNKACNRYILSSGPAEDMMCRSVENIYMKAVNGSGVFTTACTDGQAKYEAYLCAVRGKTTQFRAKHYSPAQKAGAAFAARKQAIARNHICLYEDSLYSKYPRLAGSMRPEFGYYTPFVTNPTGGTMTPVGGVPKNVGYLAAVDSINRQAFGKVKVY